MADNMTDLRNRMLKLEGDVDLMHTIIAQLTGLLEEHTLIIAAMRAQQREQQALDAAVSKELQ